MRRLKSRKGQGLVEYVLAISLMAVLVIGGIRFLGKKTHDAFITSGQTINSEVSYSQTTGQSERAIGG